MSKWTKGLCTSWSRGQGAVVIGGILFFFLSCRLASAQAVLENPSPDSFQSGVSVLSGWACDALWVVIAIDDDGYFDENFDGSVTLEDGHLDTDMVLLQAAYGTSRPDTMGVCGDTDNGFGVLYNWNNLGDGVYTVQAFYSALGQNGDLIETRSAPVTVTVTTLGQDFLRGAEKEVSFTGFPSAGDSVSLQWQQSLQNFVIRGTTGASGGHAGAPPKILENPQPGAFVSGIGAISGWACDAGTIEIEFDNDPTNRWQAGHQTHRPDTMGVCGHTNSGFGLLYNWNNLGDGTHTVRAFADGVEFASATVVVTTFGEEFLRGASGTFTVSDFPQPGINVDLLWQQSQQNFAIAGVSGDGSEGVRAGLAALKAGNVREANTAFRQATIADPTDTTAGLYHAMTRIATKALDTPQLRELARRSGMSLGDDASDVCLVDFSLPAEIPSGAPQTAEIFKALRDVLGPEIDAALTTLNGLPASVDVPFVLGNLPSCYSMLADGFVVEIDRSDVQALTATLQAIRGLLEVLAAYDVDVGLQALKTPTLQEILAAEPTTLPLVSSTRLSSARTFFDQALTSASQAISSILAETDSQADDVIVVTPGGVAEAQTIKRILDLVRQSLGETVVLPTDIGLDDSERLNLSVLFSGRIGALRPLLLAPGGTFSDPTFGGIAPDFTQQDIDAYTPENFLMWLGGNSVSFGDDYGNTPAEATPISLDTNVGGTIEQNSDLDYFTLGYPSSIPVRIAIRATGPIGIFVRCLDPATTTLVHWSSCFSQTSEVQSLPPNMDEPGGFFADGRFIGGTRYETLLEVSSPGDGSGVEYTFTVESRG